MKKRMIQCLLLTVLLVFLGVGIAYGDDSGDWLRFQNTVENNAVTDRPTPGSQEETSLLWAKQLVEGYTISFTPPLIIHGDLYTASKYNVYRMDRQTGEILQTSDRLLLDVGYAMNPITYGKYKGHEYLFVPISYGRVQCLDANTLKSLWVSKQIAYNQTLSPITFREIGGKGYVYTGTWDDEVHDGTYFCLTVEDEDPTRPNEEKSPVWEFRPSETEHQAKADSPRGFYWAGAYATDRYLVFGSDDGSNNTFADTGSDSFKEDAVLYSVDPVTGDVIDKVTGCKGDIRTTVVFHEDHVYFATKGGWLCKIGINADGTFRHDTFSHYTMPGGGMMTAAPVVYNGRIYIGVCGTGGQFDADGGHQFAVLRDDPMLANSNDASKDSMIYSVGIPGYPQAGALLSTGSGEAGKVRLYFTFNAFPGGIYYIEDTPQTTENKAKVLYRPEGDMQQYCISTLAADDKGTLYYKNDSGYMMAVAVNRAYLNGLQLSANGKELALKPDFGKSTLNYAVEAPNGTGKVQVELDVPEGMSAEVDGQACQGSMEVPLNAGEDTLIPVTVTKAVNDNVTYHRTYQITVSELSNNADLADLRVSSSNSRNTGEVACDPRFDPEIASYTSKAYTGSTKWLNLWITPADSRAKIRVRPVSGVGNGASQNITEHGDLDPIVSNGKTYYKVYFTRGVIASTVRITVTSPSGLTSRDYEVTLLKDPSILDAGLDPLILSESHLSLHPYGREMSGTVTASIADSAVTDECEWYSSNPEVATVDAHGNIIATGMGRCEIWAVYGTRDASVAVDVQPSQVEAPIASLQEGTYAGGRSVELFTRTTGAAIHYTLDGKEPTGDSPEYKGPVALPEGEHTLRAVALKGDRYPSEAVSYNYVITPEESSAETQVDTRTGSGIRQPASVPELENGTEPDQVPLPGSVEVVLTDGTTVKADVDWDMENVDYDPRDIWPEPFRIIGDVRFPDGLDTAGSSGKVWLEIQVKKGKVQPPSAADTADSGARIVSLATTTPGAVIYYTLDGSDPTVESSVYTPISPIELPDAGPAHQFTVKAVAMKTGSQGRLKSEVKSFTYSLGEEEKAPAAPGKITGLKTAVNAGKKTIKVGFVRLKNATDYQVSYRIAGAAKWKTLRTRGKTSATITGLKKDSLVQVKVAGVNGDVTGPASSLQYCLVGKTSLKVKAGRKSATVTLTRNKAASGYHVYYALKKNMAARKTATVKKLSKKGLKVKKLKAKKTYYFQAVPYRKYKGKTYVGEVTAVRKVKVKS